MFLSEGTTGADLVLYDVARRRTGLVLGVDDENKAIGRSPRVDANEVQLTVRGLKVAKRAAKPYALGSLQVTGRGSLPAPGCERNSEGGHPPSMKQ